MARKDKDVAEQCTATYGEQRCTRPAGHSRKHLDGALTWTDAGAAQSRADQEIKWAERAKEAGGQDEFV
jgi:hypothetical protein